MKTNKQCSTCKWFAEYEESTLFGDCICPIPNVKLPIWMKRESSMMIREDDGFNCETWKRKESK